MNHAVDVRFDSFLLPEGIFSLTEEPVSLMGATSRLNLGLRAGFSSILVLETRALYVALPLHSYVQCPVFFFFLPPAGEDKCKLTCVRVEGRPGSFDAL